MINQQLYLALLAPFLGNVLVIGILIAYINAKIDGVNTRFDSLQQNMNERFRGVDERFVGMNQRFDDMRDLWRAELHRVEEILDARLKHIEEERQN